jgi:hypothetical protein
MIPVFFSSAWMILLECHESPAIGNLGVQRAWSEIMNVLANPRGSVGCWNLNF